MARTPRIRRHGAPSDATGEAERFFSHRAQAGVVFPEWLSLLPPWLVVGVVLGLASSLVAAGVFVVGDRLFPADTSSSGPRVDGVGRRRAEIRDYLDAVGETYVEDHPVHGESVAFFLPDRDVAITFDARAYFRIERAGTFAVLCEHEMPGSQLGRRLPFEVPTDRLPDADLDAPVAAAFDHLRLPPTASTDEVRSAYRDRVKEVHPDHGGDPEEFKRLREAYATAREHLKAA